MSRLCEGRVAIVTGAGRGIGREHALSLAAPRRQGRRQRSRRRVDGSGGDLSPAQQVVDEITGMGGEAVANGDSVGVWEGAQRLINTAVETFGDLHVVVNNAGILRDRVLANMTEEEWDAVINVHLKGTFAPVAVGRRLLARAGQVGRAGERPDHQHDLGVGHLLQPGTDQLRRRQGRDRGDHDHRRPGSSAATASPSNAVAPVALTRMTEGLGPAPETDEEREMRSPRWIAPIVTWLASAESSDVTGRVFEASPASSSPSPRAGGAARPSPRSTTRPSSAPSSPTSSPRPARTPGWTAVPAPGPNPSNADPPTTPNPRRRLLQMTPRAI